MEDVSLTQRELDVLGLIAGGRSNAEIAETLFVSINSVKTYIRGAYRKIGVERRAQAVLWAEQHGLVEASRRFEDELSPDTSVTRSNGGTVMVRAGRR